MAANYPQSLDTDANLILVSGTDALIPAHHNNTKDAVEAVELSLGAMDNTLGGRVGASFASPLMHQAGVRSLAARNPYQPFGVPASSDLYAVRGTLPAGATLDAGLAADFTADAPYLRLKKTGAASTAYLHLPLAVATPTCVIGRIRPNDANQSLQCGVGFRRVGDTGLTGIRFAVANEFVDDINLDNGTHPIGFAGWFPPGWLHIQVFADGANIHYGYSWDGILWSFFSNRASAVALAEVVVSLYNGGGVEADLWVDFVQQGVGQIGA